MSKKWWGLDRMMPALRKLVVAALPPDGRVMTRDELKFKAGVITQAYYKDVQDTESTVCFVNIAVLALMTNAQPNTWLCRPSAARVIHGTDLRSIPTLPPRIMRQPGVIEARRPETGERLWGDVASFGWYSIGETYWLIGLSYPDGYMVARWTPRWTGEDLDEQLPALDPSAIVSSDKQEAYYDFAFSAARYLLVLGLLAESEPSPLWIVLDKSDKTKKRRDVYLEDQHKIEKPRNPSPVPLLDGRFVADVSVTGHLKRQRYGEGHAKVKWIYVRAFSARRWFSPRWLVMQLGTGEIM